MNETIQTLLHRRSVRKYKPVQVRDEDLALILQCGLYAPNGGSCQYTRLLVVQNQKILERINAVAKAEFLKWEIVEGMYKSKVKAVNQAKQEGYCFTYHAPTLIVAVSKKGHGNGMADCALALGNMMNAADSLGYGSCYVNQMHWLTDTEAMRAAAYDIGMREDEDIYGGMILGVPDSPIQKPAARAEERVIFNR